jgi:3-methyladenine DNA glycosylase/8-oxoguanine DNA glycosylase
MSPFKLKITPTEYATTLKSHGWFDLAPFRLDIKDLTLTLAFKVQNGDGAFKIFINDSDVLCEVLHGKNTTVIPVAEKCLPLDVDLSKFYALVSGNENFTWLSERGFGRYLRSPTLYEDCVKIVATANMKWAHTRTIVQNLIENYGNNVNGTKVFPEPARIASVSEQELKARTKCGYRAGSYLDIANNSMKEPDVFVGDAWKKLSPKEFFDRLLEIRGMGPASASYLCRIYGKPHIFSVDSWVAKICDELWGLNYRKTDKKGKEKPDLERYGNYAMKRYASFKEYGPSVFWFEISKYWHDNGNWDGDWW